jgi:hypothetical protein
VSQELVVRGHDGREVAVKRGPTLKDYLRPWAALPILAPAGFLAHWMWGDAGLGTGLAAAAIAAAGGAVTYVTHRLTDARTWYAHNIATATMGAGTAWLSAATAFGAGRPMLDILIIGGIALCSIADVHLWAAGQGTSEAAKAKEKTAKGKILPPFSFAAAKLKLDNVTAKITSETEMQQRSELTLTDGTTAEDVQRYRKELASFYKVAPGGVRVIENPSDASKAELVIVKQDVMRKLIPWPGLDPKLVGASIADAPLKLGLYEDGEDFVDDLNNRHTLTVGMSGSGKSVYGKVKIVETAARSDTFVCSIDLVKGRQTLGPVENAIGWPVYTKADARALLEGLKRAVRARANHLAAQGLGQWVKGCGLTLLHVVIEEAARVVDFDEVVELLQEARSTGIHMELSLQRATWTNLDTDARANLGDGICLGVKDEADAGFVLPDYVIDAGCDPSKWRKSRPGAAYAAIERVEADRHTTAVKFFGPPSEKEEEENNDLKPAADSLPDQDSKLDPITREAFGAAYAKYLATRRGTTAAAAPSVAAPAPQAFVAPAPAAEAAAVDHQEDTDVDEFEPIVLEGEDPDPDIEVTIDDKIELPDGAADFQLVPPARTKESAEEGRRRLAAQLQLWLDQGVNGDGFTAPELGRALADQQGLKRSRGWVLKELRRLEGEGRVWQDDDAKWHVKTADHELVGA